jgi:hypothetical protein
MSRNDDVLRAGLQALVAYLNQFARKHLEPKYGPGFKERLSRRGERPFSDTDPRALIKAILSEWEVAFRVHAAIQVKNYLHTVRDIANRHAHHDRISKDEVHHALVTMRLLAVSIGGAQALSEFDRLLSEQPDVRNTRSVAQPAAAVPKPIGSTRTDEVLDPNLLDAHSAVNRAVLCPACRDRKVFKMWPLGWDAHAAYKCEGLKQGDPEDRKREFRARFDRLFR